MSSPSLTEKNVVVTGAGSGLGRAYATAAADAGAFVVVNDLDADAAEQTAAAIRDRGGRAVSHAADVSDWSAASKLIERCVTEAGRIDGLVNNAGILTPPRAIADEDPRMVRWLLEVNVCGTIFPASHAVRAMLAGGGGGTIVNVSSGDQCGSPLVSTYGATKGAASSLTYAWAAELAEHGIRVNAISPNARTKMVDDLCEELGLDPETQSLPDVDANAAVVTFLLSERSRRLSGQILRVDDQGLSVMAHPLIVMPRAQVSDWTAGGVADVFDAVLRDSLQPLGLSEAEVQHRRSLPTAVSL